jgi:hypothetical protein
MTTCYAPDKIEEITVMLKVKLAYGRGEVHREMMFSESKNGRETVTQLADLMLSACDLALSTTRAE